MKDADKIKELEDRIKELENELEGAIIFLSNIAPLLKVYGMAIIENGNIDDGAMVVSLANKLKNPENCPKLFLGTVENKDTIIALGKQLEAEIKKMSN